jgi:hypothetical protein
VEDPTPSAAPGTGDPTIRCDQCGETVPDLTYCVRCGDPLGPEQRKGRAGRVRDTYAAVPGERANALRLVSTIYPSLPREEIRTFQLALIAGSILIALLGLLGFFPVAIVAAAILVPLITIIYVYDVDVYEDEPLRVVALTFVWGLVTGGLFAFAVAQLFPITATDIAGGSAVGGGGGTPFPFVRGVIAPIVAVVLMIAGPVVLLPYKRFNDVLDGATFGVASAVAFIGAQTLVTSVNLFASGLQPVGEVAPWVFRLLVLGIGMPIIAAGAIGGLGGALWLRYRAPVKDRARLGPVGQPIIAFIIAAGLLVIASAAELLMPDQLVAELIAVVIVAALAVVALLWLRRVIHLGLLQEASEIGIGPDIACPECGKQTPFHTYCGNCGASLKALPRTRQHGPAAAATSGDLHAPHQVQPAVPDVSGGPSGLATSVAGGSAVATTGVPRSHGWLDQRSILALFAVVLLAAVAVAAVFAFNQGQKRDVPPCEAPESEGWDSPGTLPCAGLVIRGQVVDGSLPFQASGRHPFSDRQPFRDETLGFSLEYDPTVWEIASQDAGFLVLSALGGNVALIFEGTTSDRIDQQRLLDSRSSLMADRLLGFTDDTEPARQLLGDPILGYRDAIARLSGGTIDSGQGPTTDMTVATVVGTDGTIVVGATLITPVELTIQRGDEQVTLPIREAGLQLADSVLNSFTWPADEVPQ